MRTCLGVLLGLLLLSRVGHAQDFEGARRSFAEAQASFEAKRYKTAAAAFEHAYDIVRDPVLLYNIGEAWERAGDGKKAVEAYRAYIGAVPGAQDAAAVNKRIHSIVIRHYKLPNQSVAGDEPAPLPPPPVVTPPPPVATPVVVTPPPPPPAPVILEPTLTPVVPVAPVTPVSPEVSVARETHRSRGLWAGAWASVGITAAALAAGITLDLFAHARQEALERTQRYVLPSGQPDTFAGVVKHDYDRDRRKGEIYEHAAIGCFAVAGAAAVAATVLFIVDGRRANETHAMQLVPALGKDSAGLSLSGSF